MAKKNRHKQRTFMHDGYENFDNEGGYTHPSNGFSHVKKGWDTGDAPKVCTNCDFHPKDAKQKLMMEYATWRALMALCAQVKVEWQALLKGTIESDGTVRINGYIIPKQEVGPAFVHNLDVIDDEYIRTHGIVAGVHSHGTMECFFSSTDHTDTNMSLVKHNIVVNNKGSYKALSRVDLPCGMVKFVEGDVYTYGEPDLNLVGVENIVEKKYGYTTPTTDQGWKTHKDPIQNKHSAQNFYPGRIDGIRWCPQCDLCPEEDGGEVCTCWTTSKRMMLPDFTYENYTYMYGRAYELKDALAMKYQKQK